MMGAQKWLVEHACFSPSSGVEIHLKLAVSKVAAKATALGGRRGPQSLQGQARARHGGGEWACYCRTSPLKIPSRRNWECPSGSPGPYLSSCHFLYSNPQKFPISFFIKLNLLLPTCKTPLSWYILPRIPSSRSPPNPTLSFSSLFTLPKHTVYFTGFDQKV